MITLTRIVARQLKTVLGKLLGKPSFITVRTDTDGLHVRGQSPLAAVEYREPGTFAPGTITLPFSLLKEIEGSKSQPVKLAPATDNRVTATWLDGQIPKSITVDVLEPTESDPAFPAAPTNWLENDPELIRALVDATATVDSESSRYALGCVQLRGRQGVLAATDGRQLLKQSGYAFPFEDEVLVPGTKVFASKELNNGEPVHVGRTDTHVVFRSGPWTIYLSIQTEGRFPRIDDIIPRAEDANTTVDLAAPDHEFLTANLRRLPMETQQFQEVTVELNGSVAIRAKPDEGAATELILSNSYKTGGDIAFCTDRRFLQRVAELGLPRLYVYGPDRPVLGQDDRRQLVWMVLDKSGIVPRSAATTQVCSPITTSPPIIHSPRITAMPKRTPQVVATESPAPNQTVSVTSPVASPQKTARQSVAHTPLEHAVQLRTTLREALTATSELVRAIQHQKKQDRALRNTLTSLRQLQAVA